MATIAFLHTAKANEETFGALVRELAPDVPVVHVTDPSLLVDAQARGGVDADLERRIVARLEEVAGRAEVAVCTCSTIAGAMEELAARVGVELVRVDRPMIEAALDSGHRLAVVVALDSTIEATTSLIESVAAERGVDAEIEVVGCPDAWELLLAGDVPRYHARIAEAVDSLDGDHDAVVLAQASMAGAIDLVTTTTPVFASPRLAVEVALDRCRSGEGPPPAPSARSVVRGPFADGPPASALLVDAPVLRAVRFGDLSRLIRCVVVLAWSTVRALGRRLLRRTRTPLVDTVCDGLVDGFITLGPTFVKAGQIIASSAAMFPPPLATAARRCLDAVPPFPVGDVHRTLAEDLGRPTAELFASFDDSPLSAASVGQVHACTLHDGRQAVVKVQRPGIRRMMARDLRNGYKLAALFERSPWGRTSGARGIIADLHAVTFQELNPALEAWRQDRFRDNLWKFGDNEWITVPEIYWDHCGPRVICMERVHGIPMDQFEAMQEWGIDGQAVLRRGAKAWAEAVMVHGPFHGDMHAGNIWALHDGRGCFLDFGIMGELPDDWKQVLKDLFYTCTFDLDFVRVARAYRSVGAIPEGMGSDEELGAFLNGVLGPMLTSGFGSINIAELVTQSTEMLKAYNASIPQELVLIAKQLLYIDKYTKFLAPDYSITADPYIVKNIFPVEAAAKAAEQGIDLEDPPLP